MGSNLIIFIALSIIITPYILTYNHKINKVFSKITKPIETKIQSLFKIKTENISNLDELKSELNDHIIIFGLGRMGSEY
jgi:Tfp pilus assembly protein PilO